MLRTATAVLLLAVPAVLAGCGGASSGSGQVGSAPKHADMVAFAACMRAHGVPSFPDPGGNGHGGLQVSASQRSGQGASLSVNGVAVRAPAFRSAMTTCRSHLPNGGVPSAADTARMRAQALAMSRCMRAHGVPNFPDPTFGRGPGGGFAAMISARGMDPNSPAFKAAQNICGPLGKGGP
jgi:hypothetical protein